MDVSILEIGERSPVAFGCTLHPRDAIRPSYDGQDHSALLRLVPDFDTQPRLQLDVIRIPGGYLHFSPGRDGIAATADGAVIRETTRFSSGLRLPPPEILRLVAKEVDADWVSVVDCAWHNHFHLLTLAMPKLYLARRHLPEARVVIPALRGDKAAGVQASAMERMIGLAGFSQDVDRVRDGFYRVRNLYLIWPNYDRGAFLHFFDAPFADLEALGRSVSAGAPGNLPQRIFILRPHDPRIDGQAGLPFLERHLRAFGFVPVQLEALDLEDQIRLFRHATRVVAAHGAGLSNLVFGNRRLRILEINLDLDGLGYLRPWFLLLACGNGAHYQYLNASAGQFTEERIAEAFERLMAPSAEAA